MLKRILLFAGLFGFFGACAADATAFVKLCDEDRYEEAAKLLDGLDAGNPEVGRRLGLMYYAGRGVARDEAKGLELLEGAMFKGDAWAAVTLGKIALRAEKNLAKVAWYVFAAECCGEDAAEDEIAKLRDALGDRYPASVVIHVGRLQRELAAARKDAAAAAAAREAGEKKSAQAEDALKAAQAEQKKMSETLVSLQAELEAAKAARDNLQAEQEKALTAKTRLEADLEKALTAKTRLEADLEKALTAKPRLEADLEKAKAEMNRLTADLEDAKAEKVQLSVDLEDAKAETKKVSDELDGTKKVCEALVAERDAVKSELDAVKAEMAALEKARDGQQDKPVRADVAEKKAGDAAAEPKTPGLEDLGLPSDGKAAKDDNMVAVPRDEIYQKYNALVKKHNELVRRYNKLLAQSQGTEVFGRP